jgi:hypothetical protein
MYVVPVKSLPYISFHPSAAITGLDWPSNGEGSTRFRFTGAALPTITPLTVLWRIYPVQQTGYYTAFFWAEDTFTFFNPDVVLEPYFGCHPYPQGGAGGTAHNWEIAVQGQDDIEDENGNSTVVTKGQWYQQAAVATVVGGDLNVNFYWNVGVNLNRLINYRSTGTWYDNQTWTSPAMTWGDAPWSPDAEQLSGILRGIIMVQSELSTTHITNLSGYERDADVISYANTNSITLWYLNMNPTPSDITDKSGAGHNPAWVGANRPTLWEGTA